MNIRVEVRAAANVEGLTDGRSKGWTENRIPISGHAKSRRNNNTAFYSTILSDAMTPLYPVCIGITISVLYTEQPSLILSTSDIHNNHES